MMDVLVYGASGHGRVVADSLMASGQQVVGFCDDDPHKRGIDVGWAPRQGGRTRSVVAVGHQEVVQLCREHGWVVALGIGSNTARRLVHQRLERDGVEVVAVVHPMTFVSPMASLGAGTVVMAGTVVNANAVIGPGVILNTGCTVDHDNHVDAFAHISPGAHLGGNVRVGEGTHVGIGASVRNDVVVGRWSIVGAGAAVVTDLPDHVVAVGVPAQIARRLDV